MPGKLLIGKQPFEPEMILIPAGEFLMGSDAQRDKMAFPHEQHQHTLTLTDYYLSKTLVTNAQYREFVQVARYNQPKHWNEGCPTPGKADHPVVNVSWYDAMAYCRWLSEVTMKRYSLPSEAEWEKGARGVDGRIYLWGNQWDEVRCNCRESHWNDTTPVDAYPDEVSPYGVLDMAGNVWEWTRSLISTKSTSYQYPYNLKDGRERLYVVGNRVLRGGAFGIVGPRLFRCAFRRGDSMDSSTDRIGFRVVMHP